MPLPSVVFQFRSRASQAFTLIELLTVIAIIGILAAIMIPTVGAVRKQANAALAMSNIRQMATAQLMYAGDNKDWFTPVYAYNNENTTWRIRLLPYLYPKTEGMNRAERTTYINSLRGNRNYVMDVPDAERHDSNGEPLNGVGINSFVAIKNDGDAADRGRTSVIERPGTIILLGEMQDKNSDTMDYTVVGYRRSGQKAYMGFCDGRVRLVTEAELQEQASSKGSLWRWKYGG